MRLPDPDESVPQGRRRVDALITSSGNGAITIEGGCAGWRINLISHVDRQFRNGSRMNRDGRQARMHLMRELISVMPITETSSGTLRPSVIKACTAPIASRSLVAKRAVRPGEAAINRMHAAVARIDGVAHL